MTDTTSAPLPWEEVFELTTKKEHPQLGTMYRVEWRIFNIPIDAFKEMIQEADGRGWVDKKWYYLIRETKPQQLWINERIKAEFETLVTEIIKKYEVKVDQEKQELDAFLLA